MQYISFHKKVRQTGYNVLGLTDLFRVSIFM